MNSALTTTIVGTLKGVIATTLGFFFLGGVDFHLLNICGILLNTAGGVSYSVIKYQGSKAAARSAGRLPLVNSYSKSPGSNSKNGSIDLDELKPRTPDKMSTDRLV